MADTGMDEANRKRVIIVGAGVSGLSAVKACVEEGLQPICFETSPYIGGLWHHTEEVWPGQGAVAYDTLRTNTSKWMMCFSDFPFPANAPPYPMHTHVLQYLEDYADKFDLKQYIQLNHTVEKVRKCPGFDHRPSWFVTVRNKATDVTETWTCPKLVLGVGLHGEPIYPMVPGIDTFNGELIHSLQYRTGRCLQNKKILIVGNGYTAGDVAVEACGVAKSVCLSVGRGTWISHRHGPSGTDLPADFSLRRLFLYLPLSILNRLIMRKCNKIIDHPAYSLVTAENNGPVHSTSILNDKLPGLIKHGRLVVKPHLISVENTTATFNDGSKFKDIDMIFVATGYKPKWDFLRGSDTSGGGGDTFSLPNHWENLNLYKMVWPDDLASPSLAVIGGVVSIRGPDFPVIELQARWVAAVFSERLRLPSRDAMARDIDERKRTISEQYGYLKMSVDSGQYQDLLIGELGLKPSFFQMLLKTPRDLITWYLGPMFPMLGRLYGDHSWSGARQAIRDAETESQRYRQQLLRSKALEPNQQKQ